MSSLTIRTQGAYRITVATSVYSEDVCIVVYEKRWIEDDYGEKSTKSNEVCLGYLFKHKDKYTVICHVGDDVMEHSETDSLESANWWLTGNRNFNLITEKDIEQYEAIQVAHKLKHAK